MDRTVSFEIEHTRVKVNLFLLKTMTPTFGARFLQGQPSVWGGG